jgi:putative polyketide hydroxylase
MSADRTGPPDGRLRSTEAAPMPAAEREPEVLVAGAGPAGLVAGITLAGYGIGVLLVEKRAEISTLSRALVISTRNMEILRSWGLEEEVRAGAADVETSGWMTPTLASDAGTVIPLGYPTAAEAARISPSGPAWAPQDHLEPVLLARLGRAVHARPARAGRSRPPGSGGPFTPARSR